MKAKKILLFGLCGLVLLCLLAYESELSAAKENEKPSKIGVVDFRKLLQNWKKYVDYKAKVAGEEEEIRAELGKLSEEVETTLAALRTRKVGSKDYWALREELVAKQATLEVKDVFFKQQVEQIELRNQQWMRELHKEIMDCVAKIARQRGIDIVLAKDGIGLPVLLYSADELDITKDVTALLDAHSN